MQIFFLGSGFVAVAIMAGLAMLSGCGARTAAPKLGARLAVATTYPVFDFARRIGGDRFDVRMLLPTGVEPHDYEPKPGDMALLPRANLFVYMSDSLEPWARDLAKSGGASRVLVASSGIPEAETGGDPHLWLDPILAQYLADAIAKGMTEADPPGAATYAANAESVKERLRALDAKIRTTLEGAPRRSVIFGGHDTFGLFARRYDLEFLSPYRNFSPDTEPSAESIANLLKTIGKIGNPTVFYGELLEPRVASMLAKEAGAKLELLHGLHGLTAEESAAGKEYFSIMEENLAKLARTLGAGEAK